MASEPNHPHFVLFPLMAQGHLIPMIDIARLLAQRGVIVTIFTTPRNASRVDSVLSRAVLSGLQIRLVQLQFPTKEAGLPEGCETFDMVSSLDMVRGLFCGVNMLRNQGEKLFEELRPQPRCIISDACIPWTVEVAQKHHIPRVAFHGFSCFCLRCLHKIQTSKVAEGITSESEYFTVPNIPHHIEIRKSQLPGYLIKQLEEFREQMIDAETRSYGVIINTFEELEGEYVKDFKKEREDKVWCIGPVSLCNKDDLDKAQRGNKASVNENQCLKWLDSQRPQSVVYACLGSLCNLIPSQLAELALALEASEKPFIWVIRGGDRLQELEKWIKENGFEERIKGRGLLIRGWAPQVLILSHPAIGGFITHCGWNSTLEGISAGVPMITWPLFGDQFLNEKLVVQVLRTAVSIGVEVAMKWGDEEKIGVVVKNKEIKKAICMVMDEGEESEEKRKKARELSEMAKKAVDNGGSSHHNISLLIEDIVQQASKENTVHS